MGLVASKSTGRKRESTMHKAVSPAPPQWQGWSQGVRESEEQKSEDRGTENGGRRNREQRTERQRTEDGGTESRGQKTEGGESGRRGNSGEQRTGSHAPGRIRLPSICYLHFVRKLDKNRKFRCDFPRAIPHADPHAVSHTVKI
jgi:hypothetical protein